MTQPKNSEQVIEGNRLIAEFMGWEFIQDENKYWRGKLNGQLIWNITESEFTSLMLNGFEFHVNWQRLMPVVEKIEEGARVDIYGKACKISQPQWAIDIARINEKKITAVWLCVIDFIKWVNSQTSKTSLP